MKRQIGEITQNKRSYSNKSSLAVVQAKRIENYSQEIKEVLEPYAEEIKEVFGKYNQTSKDTTMALRLLRVTSPYTQNRESHQKMVAKLATKCAKTLEINVETTDIMARNHDIRHTFYGHGGEWWLSKVKGEIGLGEYTHNSLAPKELIYRYGMEDEIINRISALHPEITKGELSRIKNSLWIIFDGINSHNGELADNEFIPNTSKTHADFREEVMRCHTEKGFDRTILPATIEGCLIRMCDKIAYTPYDMLDGIYENFIEGIGEKHKRILLELGITEEEIEEANRTWKTDKEEGHRKYEMIASKVQDRFVNSVIENSSKSVIKMDKATSILMHRLREVNNQEIIKYEVLKEDNEIIPVAIMGAMNRFADVIQRDISLDKLRTIKDNGELKKRLTTRYKGTPYESFISYISTTNPDIFDFNEEMIRRVSEKSAKGKGISLERKLELEFGAEYLSTLSDSKFFELMKNLKLINEKQEASLTRKYVDIGIEGLKKEYAEPDAWQELRKIQADGLRRLEETEEEQK